MKERIRQVRKCNEVAREIYWIDDDSWLRNDEKRISMMLMMRDGNCSIIGVENVNCSLYRGCYQHLFISGIALPRYTEVNQNCFGG